MNGYTVIIEGHDRSYSAYVPDLPGCVVAGVSVAEVEELMHDAIRLHIDNLREHGEDVPPPSSVASTVIHPPAGKSPFFNSLLGQDD